MPTSGLHEARSLKDVAPGVGIKRMSAYKWQCRYRHYHLERALRPIPAGRRNWLFAWTEVGAGRVGVVQGLLATCTLQGVDPYTYLVDVLQRVGHHPASNSRRGCGRRCSPTTRCAPTSTADATARR